LDLVLLLSDYLVLTWEMISENVDSRLAAPHLLKGFGILDGKFVSIRMSNFACKNELICNEFCV